MFRSENTKETKKNVKESNKNTKVVSRSDGNISTSTSYTRNFRTVSTSSQSNTFYNEGRTIERFSRPGPSSRTNSSILQYDAVPFNVQSSRPMFTNQTFSRATAPSPFERNQPNRSTVPKTLPSYNSPLQVNSPPQVVNLQSNDLKSKLTVKVKASTCFYDDPTKSKVPVYKTRSKNKGYLLLINNIRFKANSKEKIGVELDEKNLIALFKGIGFQVTKHRNLNKKELENNIKKFRDKDSLKKYDIATVIVMSDGTGNNSGDNTKVLCSDGLYVDTSWIVQQFNTNECKNLVGKPKIFIFQCCRAYNIDAMQIDTDHVTPRQQADMLIAYATVPGFIQHRDPNIGTLYMQCVCEIFMEHAHDTDVESLLKLVDCKIRRLVSGGLKPTYAYENRGFKTCFFHPKHYE